MLVPLVLLLGSRLYFWAVLPFATDDAYITFRYARNLARGEGLVFNLGERVFGFTSPIWVFWNSLAYPILHDPVFWSRCTSLAADLTTLVLLTTLIRRGVGLKAAWCFGLFFSAWPYFGALAMSGMEISTFVALIVLSAVLAKRKSRAAGPVLAALALTRPEGVAAACLLAWPAARRDRIVALALAGAGYIALAWYFGSPIPQSLLAKAQVYGTPGPLAGRHWWEWLVPLPLGRWPVTTEGGLLFAMAVVAGPAVLAGAAALRRLRGSALAYAIGAGLVVWVGYGVFGVAYFSWYLAVPLVAVGGLACIGLPRIARGLWVQASLALFVLGTWTVAPEIYRARAYAEYRSFAGAAQFLGKEAEAGETVLLEPIGIVGWSCKLSILDEIGLVSPGIAERRRGGPGWMSDVVAWEGPDWLVVRRSVFDSGRAFAGVGAPFRNEAERDTLLARYPLVARIHEEAGDAALEIRARSR